MTREEAIKTLRNTAWLGTDKKVGQVEEAIQIAITALKAQDVDAVSRQAVMWMLTNLSYTQCRTQGEVEVIGLAKTMLIAMPSAQDVNNSNQEVNNSTATQPNGIESQVSYRQVTGKLDITDCISRQAAIDEIEYELEMINSTLDSTTLDFNARERLRQRRGEAREILNSIQQLPSAQPEIIRCRDCGKCQYDTLFDKYWCNGREVREDFYCGDAVRKEN